MKEEFIEYPIKCSNIYLEKIWGGNKIKNQLKLKPNTQNNCGEAWLLSSVEQDSSIISNGAYKGVSLNKLTQQFPDEILGSKGKIINHHKLPLLIKFIDAAEDLSIQVHPNDEIALKKHNCKGKTEMWYVLNADENTKLVSGFNQNTSKYEVEKLITTNNLEKVLNYETVTTGDSFFLPAGRIHTIGKGCLILEVQQTSDITYRVFDFNRKDNNGNTRDLHVKDALDALDYNLYNEYKLSYQNTTNNRINLVDCEYFNTNKIVLTKNTTLQTPSKNSFTIYIATKGNSTLIINNQTYNLKQYQSVLIPACIHSITFNLEDQETELIETYIP